jgi:hypothetical protein
MLYLPNYAGAFRCIGQELQRQNIDVFGLKSHAGEYFVQCGDPNPPYTAVIKMLFSKERIEMIDREGRRQRGRSSGEIRFDGIPEILRAAGEHLDKKGADLRSINNSHSWSDAVLELEYQTRAGQTQMETLTMSFLRQASVRMYQRRTRLTDPVHFFTRKR